VKNLSALLFLVKNLAEQLFLAENISVLFFFGEELYGSVAFGEESNSYLFTALVIGTLQIFALLNSQHWA